MSKLLQAYLVCNAHYNDTNFARLQLLQMLAVHDDTNVWVGSDDSDLQRIESSDVLITYTCDVVPSPDEQLRLRQWVERGGRWFALHGTNAIIEFVGPPIHSGSITIPGKTRTPDSAPMLMALLGSRFVAHPPSDYIDVRVVDPTHPIVAGLTDSGCLTNPTTANSHRTYADCLTRGTQLQRRPTCGRIGARTYRARNSTYARLNQVQYCI